MSEKREHGRTRRRRRREREAEKQGRKKTKRETVVKSQHQHHPTLEGWWQLTDESDRREKPPR